MISTCAGRPPPPLPARRRRRCSSSTGSPSVPFFASSLPAIALIALISCSAHWTGASCASNSPPPSGGWSWSGSSCPSSPAYRSRLDAGASPVPLPLGPVYGLQLAVSYVNLAIPTSAARFVVNIRFFQRHGVPPGTAVAAGALDGFGGFVVQWAILLGLLRFTPVSLDLDLSADVVGSAARILGLVSPCRGRARRRPWRGALAPVRPGLDTASGGRGVRGNPWAALPSPHRPAHRRQSCDRGALCLGARHLHPRPRYPIGLGELLLVNIGVALLSGLLPVPGGIGVAEAGLTFGLVQAGMPDEIVFGAVLMYRLLTFYLPPIWGYFSLRWLERNNHL